MKSISYGMDNNGYFYVQVCCEEEHVGQKCECKSLGENFATENEAKDLAIQKAKEMNIKINKW